MSDFVSGGWSIFIAAVTVLALLACLVLLLIASRRKVMADDNSTGHVWDEDLRELNNPLPRWWMILFVLTVIFAGVYLALYPGLGSYSGGLRWSSAEQLKAEQDSAQVRLDSVYSRYASMSAADLIRDSSAMGVGERLYLNHCSACHGSDARGSKGYPNLTDNDWLYGGSHEAIKQTIAKGRVGNMPAMAAALGSSEDVKNVAHYVLSLSGSAHNAVSAQLGKPKFGVCAACHGTDGKGNQALGAPDLSDNMWLHGWGEASIVAMINHGKVNQMPAHESRLSAAQIHVLGAYVMSLSQGTQMASR